MSATDSPRMTDAEKAEAEKNAVAAPSSAGTDKYKVSLTGAQWQSLASNPEVQAAIEEQQPELAAYLVQHASHSKKTHKA